MKNTQNVNGDKILPLKTSWKNDCKQLHVFLIKREKEQNSQKISWTVDIWLMKRVPQL